MKGFFSIFFIFFSLLAYAQEPVMLSLQGIGGNGSDQVGTNVTKTNDGGFIIGIGTNSAHSTGNIDTFSLCTTTGNYSSSFIKYNGDASLIEWKKCYDQRGDSAFGYIFPTSDGGVVLGGGGSSTIGEGFLISKQDAFGSLVWNKWYSKGMGAIIHDMIATSDGGFVMVGDVFYTDTNFTVHNSGSLNGDIAIIKLDSLGNKEWSKAIGGTDDEVVYRIIENTDAGYYIVGGTASNDYDCTGNHGLYDVYLARLDKNGNILWHRDLGGSDGEIGRYATANGKGGIIIAATTSSNNGDISHPVAPNPGYWAVEVDSNRDILWDNCYGGGGGYCGPNSICKATDGSIWIAGISSHIGGGVDTAYGGVDAWILHTDSIGNFLNAKVLGSSQQDEAFMIHPLSNGNVIAGGYYWGNNGSFTSLDYYGYIDIFLSVFSPFTTEVPQIQNTKNEVKIFPNPAKDQVTIKKGKEASYSVEIYNSIGSVVYKTNLTDTINVNVSEWPIGVYYVRVVGESGDRQALKLLVE